MEEHHFISSPQQSSSKPHQVPFDLLKKALNLHIRICIHKKAEKADLGGKGGEEVWFVEEVTELLRWCDRVLVPALHYNSRYVRISGQKASLLARYSKITCACATAKLQQ